MLLGNYNQWNANPGREFAGVTNRNYFKTGSVQGFYYPDEASEQGELAKAAFPNGYSHPYAFALAPKAGGLGTWITQSGTLSASIAGGRNAEASIECSAALSATMQLVVSAVAAITASASLTGNLNAIAPLSASITAGGSLTATLKALGNAVAVINASATASATAGAIGHMEAEITTTEALSAQGLANSLWNALASSYNTAGTMGAKLNAAGSGGVDYDALAQAVLEALPGDFDTDPQSLAGIVKAMQAILGLDAANPVTTTPTSVSAGDIDIAITGDGTTSTTLTRQ